jgi:cell division protease FtsH
MLVEMDGFEPTTGVIVLAATNRADILDKALLRPGRFDRQIYVNNPDTKGREKILAVHFKKIKTAPDVDLSVIARGTPGFSGADLANLANEAALVAARKNRKLVTMREIDEARDKVLMGLERRSLVMKPEELRRTAYHEAGHAITTLLQPGLSDPIHKATIVPRGAALGMVQQLPEGDRVSRTLAQYKADLVVYMGGRAAEEIEYGVEQVSSGATSDIKGATRIAQMMIRMAGYSTKIGYVHHEADALESEATKQIINSEVKQLIDDAYAKAIAMINENRDKYVAIAEALLKYETLTGDELQLILEGGNIEDAKMSLSAKAVLIGESLMPKIV